MKEKVLLRDYKFREYLKTIGLNRKLFKKLTYATKSKLVINFYTSIGKGRI